MRRTLTRLSPLALAAALLLGGCASAADLDLPAPGPMPTAEPVALAPYAPGEAKAPVPITYGTFPNEPLHGAPPLVVSFRAHALPHGIDAGDCRGVVWDFGDGAGVGVPCPGSAQGGDSPVRHVYRDPGTYHVRRTYLLTGDAKAVVDTHTVVVAHPQPRPWHRTVLYYGALALAYAAAGAAALWLWRRGGIGRLLGCAAVALLLVTYVPPLSYLPNPVGLWWALRGGYRYDPRLPFVNRMVIATDPTERLRPLLDGLIGHTGLDPLDPVEPLAAHEFLRVWDRPPNGVGDVTVATRMVYADGSARVYEIPLSQPNAPLYKGRWVYDGLGRLRTDHRDVGLTMALASPHAPIRLGDPQRLSLSPEAVAIGAAGRPNWFWMATHDVRAPVWSPGGRSALVPEGGAVWWVPLDGGLPASVAEGAVEYGWSPDGRHVVHTDGRWVRATEMGGLGETRTLAETAPGVRPGLGTDGVWYAADGHLWRVPYAGGEAERVAALFDSARGEGQDQHSGQPILVRPAPDGRTVAYGDGTGLYLLDLAAGRWERAFPAVQGAAWSPDGSLLAAVRWRDAEGVVLSLLTPRGAETVTVRLGPDGEAGTPQWTADGRWILVQTSAYGGRRLVAVRAATGEGVDLTPVRWDARYGLSPDGERTLATNGRGGFWLADLVGDEEEGDGCLAQMHD